MTARSFTVHNTANPDATADNHADYECNNNLTTSYHAVVDDKECVFLVPFNEQCWHAGDGSGPGNTTSLAMEVCEFTDTARTLAAIYNAERVIADAMTGKTPAGFRCPPLEIVPHLKWSGKYCPRVILSSFGWDKFVSETKTLIGGATVADYYIVVAWAVDYDNRQKLTQKAASVGMTFDIDGPIFYGHGTTAQANAVEALVDAEPNLYRMQSIPTTANTSAYVNNWNPYGATKPFLVIPSWAAPTDADTVKLAAAKAKSQQIETLCNEIQAL